MRADPADYQMVAPGSLSAILELLAKDPGKWLPVAGGTDVMVQYSAGKLASRNLVSIWGVPELRRIDVLPDEVQIGAGCTYSQIRANEVIRGEFSMLASSAGWTGGIANQNRGTLGGNIVNASPAADSLPAMLAYEATLILVSLRGERRMPYVEFHTAYKKMTLERDELIRAVCLPRAYRDYFAYTRKVGARNAQAISKVCIAALAKIAGEVVDDIRIGLGSVAPVPIRLRKTEVLLEGNAIEPALLVEAHKTAIAEIAPIDDIRSTARYRAAVAGNLVLEFLENLAVSGNVG